VPASLCGCLFFRVSGEGAYEPGGRCPPGPPRHCVEPFPCRGLPPAGSFCPCGRLCPLVISSSPLVITRTRRCRGDARTTSGVMRRTFTLGASSDWRTWRPRAHHFSADSLFHGFCPCAQSSEAKQKSHKHDKKFVSSLHVHSLAITFCFCFFCFVLDRFF
jgi:hypothetical protein